MAYDENGNWFDGRKENGGNKGCGPKPKPKPKSPLMEELEKGDKDIIPIIIAKAKAGDKDFVKMWASYRFGNPTAIEKDAGIKGGAISHSELLNKLKYDFEDDDEFFED